MRRALFVIVIAGCGGGGGNGPTTKVELHAGDIPLEAGATVISHTVDGDVLDQQVTDGAGQAQLQFQPGALVTAVYHRNGGYHVITTPALATGTLGIHGPVPDQAPILSNSLVLTAVPITADTITVDMGCTRAIVTSFPKTLDVLAQCLGSDSNLDVLVTATTAGNVVGYFAARVPTDGNGVGMLDIPAWNTAFTTIPVTQNDLGATLDMIEVADGFAFTTPIASGVANTWTGLVADASQVRAQVGPATAAQTTTQFATGLPASIAFASTDFMTPIATTLALRDRSKLSFDWTPLAAGDLTNLHASWMPASDPIAWDVVLPPDADHVQFPSLDPDLAGVLAAPTSPVTTNLRAVDGPDTTSFADVQADGLWMLTFDTSTIVPPPTAGELREANVSTTN